MKKNESKPRLNKTALGFSLTFISLAFGATCFYLVLKGNRSSKELFDLINEMNEFCLVFEGKIPGEDIKDCGNYLDLGLDEAKKFCLKYKEDFLINPTEDRFIYSK